MPRINSRADLLSYANEFVAIRHNDGRIDEIRALKNGFLLHTTKVYYDVNLKLERIEGYLLQEVLSDLETIENIVIKTQSAEPKTILYDDFEDLLKWDQQQATVAIDNTFAFSKSNSLKLTSSALPANVTAIATRNFVMPKSKKVAFSSKFAVDNFSKLSKLAMYITTWEKSHTKTAYLAYVPADLKWTIDSYSNVDLFTEPYQYETKNNVGGAWHELYFEADLQDCLYETVRVNGYELKPTKNITPTPSTSDQHAWIVLTVNNVNGQDVNVWFDDILLEEY